MFLIRKLSKSSSYPYCCLLECLWFMQCKYSYHLLYISVKCHHISNVLHFTTGNLKKCSHVWKLPENRFVKISFLVLFSFYFKIPFQNFFQGLCGMCLYFLRTTEKAITLQNIAQEVNFGVIDCSGGQVLVGVEKYFSKVLLPSLKGLDVSHQIPRKYNVKLHDWIKAK